MGLNTYLVGSTYDEEPGELDRPLYTVLHLRFCLSPTAFGLYTFYVTRTFYNSSSKASENVTAEHPWTLFVEPLLPDGINRYIPGYELVPIKYMEHDPADSYKEGV